MRIGILITALVALLFSTQAIGAVEDGKNTISVSGKGKASAKPDVAYVTLYAKGSADTLPDAAKKADQVAAAVEKAVKEQYKEIKSIAISGIDVGQVDGYGQGEQRPQIVNKLRITLPANPKLAYNLIDTAVHAGAAMQVQSMGFSSGVSGVLVYGISDDTALEDQAVKMALDDAKKNAEKVAALVGKKVGSVTAVGCTDSPWCQDFSGMYTSESYPSQHNGLNPQNIEITHTMQVTYELL